MLSHSGQAGFNRNFCAVTAADVTGDDYPDLWFADYDADAGAGPNDFNDKLLVNQGRVESMKQAPSRLAFEG